MKRLILISFIVGFFVDSLSAQEPFDSISYAYGNYNMRNAFEANSNLLILTDREEFFRGLKEYMNIFIQDSIYAKLYQRGIDGTFASVYARADEAMYKMKRKDVPNKN